MSASTIRAQALAMSAFHQVRASSAGIDSTGMSLLGVFATRTILALPVQAAAVEATERAPRRREPPIIRSCDPPTGQSQDDDPTSALRSIHRLAGRPHVMRETGRLSRRSPG